MIEVPRSEIFRYLGQKQTEESQAELGVLIEDSLAQLKREAQPRSITQAVPLQIDGETIQICDTAIHSQSLLRNLRGCSQVILMACTLGRGADRLIARAQLRSVLLAAVMNACANAMIEAYCDEVNQQAAEQMKQNGLYCRPRYSPGYGDLPLTFQRDFFSLLPVTRSIGVVLNDSLLMVPEKSVTALIGVSEADSGCSKGGCETCAVHNSCAYSRTERQK
ncbi:MAG: hypothetical protein IKS32_09990 [Solobacterium sp.]|nr:hypothetical protein [Solobacterium sp.]